jgi:iron complex transport system ATP-binding protein
MDEPTANLDYGNMVIVMKCIRQLAKKGLCVIFTTHMPDQAFMCNAKTAMLFREAPLVFGEANRVITEKNLYQAYHTDIQILEVIDTQGKPIRVCVPR